MADLPIFETNEHLQDAVFIKKELTDLVEENLTLEQEMVDYSNRFLGIKVMSVALPPNYKPNTKKEEQINNWLKNTINNVHLSGHILASKYGEKFNVRIERKKPYNNVNC